MSIHNQSQQATLGCGSLILIALIVMIFSGRGGDLEREVKELWSEVGALKKAIEGQSEEIRQLRNRLSQAEAHE